VPRQAEREAQQRAEEEAYRQQLMAQFAEADRVEQMNAQKRRIKVGGGGQGWVVLWAWDAWASEFDTQYGVGWGWVLMSDGCLHASCWLPELVFA
jgi:hypothetical protein